RPPGRRGRARRCRSRRRRRAGRCAGRWPSRSSGALRARRSERRPGRTRGASRAGRASELLQEPDVVLPEHADVREAVAEHEDPLEAPAEREAGHFLRVVADRLEHVRVDHPGTADLDPALVLANAAAGLVADEAGDVGFDRWLGEREEARPDPNLSLLAEEAAQEELKRALQVGEGDPLVDGEALD